MTTQNDSQADPDTVDLAERLRQAVGHFVRAVRTRADTPTSAQAETLGLLDRDGAMSVTTLAQRRNVRHQSMRLVVAQLERDDLLSRMPDPADGRGQLITLTEKGRAALAESRTARSQWIARALETVSAEDRQALRTAIATLERIIGDA